MFNLIIKNVVISPKYSLQLFYATLHSLPFAASTTYKLINTLGVNKALAVERVCLPG